MPSAKIYRFPKTVRRRPGSPPPMRSVRNRERYVYADDFAARGSATLLAVFFYLSGAGGMARHDTLYAALLVAIWVLYLFQPPLLKVRVLGPLLIVAGRLLAFVCLVGLFRGIYRVILCAFGETVPALFIQADDGSLVLGAGDASGGEEADWRSQ
jgi:hypothetical protein